MIRIICNLPRLLMAALLLLLGIAQPSFAGVFCVDNSIAIQNALITAASNGEDDELHIVIGTYVGNYIYSSDQTNELSVLGGYSADCIDRQVDATNTILDGSNGYSVLVISSPSKSILVEGLTIKRGKRITGSSQGGGLNISGVLEGNKDVIVKHNVIQECESLYGGGGVYIEGINIMLASNIIKNNISSTRDGGGVNISGLIVTIDSNSIFGNSAGGSGGGLSAGNVTLVNNIISNNISGNGCGGALLSGNSVIVGNTIDGNNSTDGWNLGGGGVCVFGGDPIFIKNNISNNNSYTRYSTPGGVDYL